MKKTAISCLAIVAIAIFFSAEGWSQTQTLPVNRDIVRIVDSNPSDNVFRLVVDKNFNPDSLVIKGKVSGSPRIYDWVLSGQLWHSKMKVIRVLGWKGEVLVLYKGIEVSKLKKKEWDRFDEIFKRFPQLRRDDKKPRKIKA